MQLDRPMFIVISDHKDGPYISETDLDRTALNNLCKDLREGQYSDVLTIIEINLAAHHCRDVTHEFKPFLERSPDHD